MKKFIIGMVLALTMTGFAQSPLADAKAKLAKEKYEARVAHIKEQLKEKERLQQRIADIDKDIDETEKGKEVPESSGLVSSGYLVYSPGGICCIH